MHTELRLPTNDLVARLFDNWNEGAAPQYVITERDDAYSIELSVPGYEKSELAMVVDKDALVVSANPASSDRGFGTSKFTRRFRLPAHVDGSSVEASCLNGVLAVRVPKAKSSVRTQVEIK